MDPVVAGRSRPPGRAPAVTGLTYATEPGSGSAIVLCTALLGVGQRLVRERLAVDGRRRLRVVGIVEAQERREARVVGVELAGAEAGLAGARTRRSDRADAGAASSLPSSGCPSLSPRPWSCPCASSAPLSSSSSSPAAPISSGEPATVKRSGPNLRFMFSYRTAFESCSPPPLPKIPPTSVAIETRSSTVNGCGPGRLAERGVLGRHHRQREHRVLRLGDVRVDPVDVVRRVARTPARRPGGRRGPVDLVDQVLLGVGLVRPHALVHRDVGAARELGQVCPRPRAAARR